VTAHPDGYYRNLWQVQDVLACQRLYPSYAMDCAGRINKADHWDAAEFDLLMRAINDGNPWAFKHGLFRDGLKTPNDVITDIATAVGFPDNADLVVWWTAYDPTYVTRRTAFMWTGAWNGFKGYRLRDMAFWVYPAAPPVQARSLGNVFAIVRPDVFGSPWLNPL
jgi:hypothetical protein